MGQGMSRAVHAPMDEVGSRARYDGGPCDIHGDAHHAVGGDRRGGRGGHCHLSATRSLKVRRCTAGGIELRVWVVGVGRSAVGEKVRSFDEDRGTGRAKGRRRLAPSENPVWFPAPGGGGTPAPGT